MHSYRSNPPSRSIPPRAEVRPRYRSLHAMMLRYMARTGTSETGLGRLIASDPTLIARMRTAEFEMKDFVEARIRAFFAREAENA